MSTTIYGDRCAWAPQVSSYVCALFWEYTVGHINYTNIVLAITTNYHALLHAMKRLVYHTKYRYNDTYFNNVVFIDGYVVIVAMTFVVFMNKQECCDHRYSRTMACYLGSWLSIELFTLQFILQTPMATANSVLYTW